MIKLVCIGAGYFARFHVEAWKRIPEVSLLAICDKDLSKATAMAAEFDVAQIYTDYRQMFSEIAPDVVDIITPPATHHELCNEAAHRGIHIICQKPLAPSLSEARMIVDLARKAGVRFMVHENFRFQPWYRKMKELIIEEQIGRIHAVFFRMRTGDGWPDDAYLNRQPYFRNMPRLLVYETGIHFIDTFRFLLGEVKSVFAQLRRLNPYIVGEDKALVLFEFQDGVTGVWDANRYNEPNTEYARYTFGEMLLEGTGGTLRLYIDGRITMQQLGKKEQSVHYHHEHKNFAADCVFQTQVHFVKALQSNQPFETNGEDYLHNIVVQDAIYESANKKQPVLLEN